MNEADTCRTLVRPKLETAGWDGNKHFYSEQTAFTEDLRTQWSGFEQWAADRRREDNRPRSIVAASGAILQHAAKLIAEIMRTGKDIDGKKKR